MLWGRIFFLELPGVFQKGVGLAESWIHSPRGFYFICKLAFADWNKQVLNYLTERKGCRKVIVSLAKENIAAKPAWRK